MRRCLLMGGVLLGMSGLSIGPAAGQERRPSTQQPGVDQRSAPGTAAAQDSLRLGELAALQAALGAPGFHLSTPLADAINLSTMITFNEYVAKTKYFHDAADMLGRRMEERRKKRVALGDQRMMRLLYDAEEVDLMMGAAPNALMDQLSKPRIPSAMLRRYGETIRLRMIGDVVEIQSIKPDATQVVYNLDVAENRDFFVGTAGLLVHDFSFVQPLLSPFDRQPEWAAETPAGRR
jgi:hypothetical protein